MFNKIKHLAKKSKKVLIITLILWVVLSILFVAPIAVGIVEGRIDGQFDFGEFIIKTFTNITNIGENTAKMLAREYITTFLQVEGYFTIVLLIFAMVGFIKSMPKNEYTDIEHRI